jgi:sortase (surface protein transpeptidase)
MDISTFTKKGTRLIALITASRHYIRVVAFAVFGAALGALLMQYAYPHLVIERAVSIPQEEVVTTEEPSLPREWPVRLRIPSIAVDAPFEKPLELNPDGTIMVPELFDTVGWYKLGASPGEKGTASILGHVDSIDGAAVFYSLGQLEPGDRIYVDRADGTTAQFEVEYLERYKQSEFPNEKVYGMTDYPSLRLITCSGTYNKGAMRYSHNAVVYARLAPSNGGE